MHPIHWMGFIDSLPKFSFQASPGPPGGLRIEDVRATSVALTWSRGSDNHSPISKYIQTKTILSDDWKDAKTGEFICLINLFMF